jgi:Undecaprenyl-phosphate glucose phosphotransferase
MEMIPRKSQILRMWYLVWDLTLTACAWVWAYQLRFHSGWWSVDAPVPDIASCFHQLPLVLILSLVAYLVTGQYVFHRFRRLREEFASVLKGTALMVLLVVAATFGARSDYESRLTFALFFLLTILLVLTARRITGGLIRWLRSRGFNQTHAIIVGTGRPARKTARNLRHASWMGIKNIGFVEDQPSRWTGDLDVLGTSADLPHLIEKYQVSHVFIALPLNRFHEARRVYDTLSQSLVEIRMVADVPGLAGVSLTTTNLYGLPIIGLRESPHFGLNIVVKRTMDILLSSLALILLSPIMLTLAALIKLTSRGPVFYRQERCGLNGKSFNMLKFRSMKVDAESKTGAVWAVKDDPRRTAFGAFLRKTSLDELPQFINVLLGHMSLVGPRPERPVFIQKFIRTIPNYHARHCVKAGITGWAQVHGWRGNTSLRKRVQFDLYYITHWTPLLDIRILWMTVWNGLFARNAY